MPISKKGTGAAKENTYFQRVALGSARESRGWYYRGRRLLDEIIAALVLSSGGQRQYRRR